VSRVQALAFSVMPHCAVHSHPCARLESDPLDQGPVELRNTAANEDEFSAPPGRCPVPTWRGMSAVGVGVSWSVSTPSWLLGTGCGGEISGSGGWCSGPCIVGGGTVGSGGW
jgi:hypothetical protein